MQIGGVYTTFCQEEAFSCKSITIEEMGGSRYCSKVSGSGVNLTLLSLLATGCVHKGTPPIPYLISHVISKDCARLQVHTVCVCVCVCSLS